jgi:hypothetical protein
VVRWPGHWIFCRRLQIKCTEHCRVKIRIAVVEKSLEVGIAVAELWPHIKPVLCYAECISGCKYVEWGSIMVFFGILTAMGYWWHEGSTSVFDFDTSSHVVRSEFIELYSESAVAEFVSFGSRASVTVVVRCSVGQGYLLVVQTQWTFWCLVLPTCNHTGHH